MHCTTARNVGAKSFGAHHSLGFATKISAFALVAAVGACSTDSPTEQQSLTTASAVRAAVTGPAANAIDPSGRFHLAPPASTSEPELTASEAVNLASVWTSGYAPMTRSWLESTHGAAIDFKTLRTCGRALYARGALSVAPQNIPSPYRRTHGPWWLVTVCDGVGSPTISVAVSALAKEVTTQAGRLVFPQIHGNEFVAIGVPLGHIGEYPMPPETAVEMVANKAGMRVVALPELITPLPTDGPPQFARWRLVLEGLATVRTNSGAHPTSEIFLGPKYVGGRDVVFSIAAHEQPATIDLPWMPAPRVGEPHEAYVTRSAHQVIKMSRRVDTPARVEPISAWGN